MATTAEKWIGFVEWLAACLCPSVYTATFWGELIFKGFVEPVEMIQHLHWQLTVSAATMQRNDTSYNKGHRLFYWIYFIRPASISFSLI